jgi:two-component system, OmpR family, sensor histidine kinase SaeS
MQAEELRKAGGLQTTGKRLLRSPLALRLLLFFGILPLVEAVFIGVLCSDINIAEQSASREFKTVKACQELSAVLESFRDSHRAVYALYRKPNDRTPVDRFEKAEAEFVRGADIAIRDLKQVGLLGNKLPRFSSAIAKLDDMARAVINGPAALAKENFREYMLHTKYAGLVFEECMQKARAGVEQLATTQPILGLDPLHVLYAAGALNAVFVLALAAFVRFRLTGPISRLTRNCEKIKSGEAIEKPVRLNNEIDWLAQSFHLMSLRIAEDNKRRKSYLELLQSVQAKALLQVSSWLERILGCQTCNEQCRRRLEKSRGSLATLLEMLNSMTETLSSPADISVSPESLPCRTSDLCASAVSAVESLLDRRGLKIKLEVEELELTADPVLLGRVLLNLLSNAAKYSPDSAEINFSARREGQTVCFSVTDSGPGITPADIGKLFRRFSQVTALDGASRPGTGLGLVICKEIVEAHGGEIGCRSTPGQGSTFWFKLPLKTTQQPKKADALMKSRLPLLKGGPVLSLFRKAVGLNLQFAAMLTIFIGVQVYLFMDLNASFRQAALSAQHFAEQRTLVMAAQNLYAIFHVCGGAADDGDLEKTIFLVERQKKGVRWLMDRHEKGSDVTRELEKLWGRYQHFLNVVAYAQDHPEKMLAAGPMFSARFMKLFDRTEDGICRILALQRASYQDSYDSTRSSRARIMTLLLVAAVTDLLLIFAAACAAMLIVERVTLLKAKAEEFAAGSSITPSLHGRDELSRLDQQLCEASRVIHQGEVQRLELIAVINHDLRTPLSSLLANLELISRGVFGELPEEPEATLEKCQTELHDLLRRINDLLLLEKINSGTCTPAKDNLKIADILAECLASAAESARKKQINLTLNAASCPETALVKGDRQLLVRLYTIVLANAISASPAEMQIKITLSQCQETIFAEIEDRGPGIAPELQGQIFDRFRFVAGKPLTGLGLPLAHMLCKMHDGSIDIRPGRDQGTTVNITLPLCA